MYVYYVPIYLITYIYDIEHWIDEQNYDMNEKNIDSCRYYRYRQFNGTKI